MSFHSQSSPLKQLMRLMPPLLPAGEYLYEWSTVENTIGLVYPDSFKEFIQVYAGIVWCDTFSPIYPEGNSRLEIDAYQKHITKAIENLHGVCHPRIHGVKGTKMPLYPQKNGLFPFMIDFSGSTYFWETEGTPDEWHVYEWERGPTFDLGALSITEMFLRWLQRQEPMLTRWGDVETWDKNLLRLRLR